ncbi:MAG: cytochrome b/b6 domain-containing protein [Anaerolineales bacterium]|jgi:cytochrome b subunit of formate dehydrogenase
MSESIKEQHAQREALEERKRFLRFDLSQRVEHIVMLVSFTILAITGLPQKFPDAPISVGFFRLAGGIEITRIIHRSSSIVLMLVSIYHIVALGYRVFVKRVRLTMMPVWEDIQHVFQDVLFYFGLREEKAKYDRYNYAEKAEYLAVVWGTVVMAITGFMMWNPIATSKILPGEFIPAAKAAHGGEAILAVLAILLWHFYHVHLKHFNKSMFTGYLTRKEMEEEHPGELERIERGVNGEPPPEVIRQRRRVFIPVASIASIVMLAGVVAFVTFEDTSITTLPPGEQAPIYVTRVPQPTPTLPPTPTTTAFEGESWSGGFEALFRNRCGTCHGITSVGGISLATYEQALEGGNSGPGIVPGDPEASVIVQIQQAGSHPGQLTEEELEQLIAWIEAGAPEN